VDGDMTAPLPPPTWPSLAKGHTGLPVADNWQATLAKEGFPYGKTEAKWNEAAVKLAVREALERAKVRILAENYWPENTTRVNISHDCAKAIDAILKEYEG
jgi:hypothetical protein